MSTQRVLIGGSILLALAVVAVAAYLVGVSVGGSSKEVASRTAENTEEEKQKTEPTQNTQSKLTPSKTAPKSAPRMSGVAQVGETAEMVDRSFTVNDVQRGWVFPHNIPNPDVGNEFIVVNITVTNLSDQLIKVNVWEFESEDSNGVGRKATPTTQVPNAIPPGSATVTPNGEFTGNLAVEFPQDDPNFRLVYRPLS